MKRLNLYVFFSFLLIGLSLAYADTSGPRATVESFFRALKQGDTAELQNLIAGSYYENNKQQIESNPSYSEFLKTHYQNSDFRITGTIWDRAFVFVDVELRTNDVVTGYSRFRLEKSGNGLWKITEELIK